MSEAIRAVLLERRPTGKQDALSRFPRLRHQFVENVVRLFVESARIGIKPDAAGPDEFIEAFLRAAGRLAAEHNRAAEFAKQLRELAEVIDPSGPGGAGLEGAQE